MKRIFCLFLLLCVLLSTLCGCELRLPENVRSLFTGSEQATAESAQTPDPQDMTVPVALQAKQELTSFGLCYQPQFGLHPYTCTSLNNRVVISFLYESLFVADESFQAKPVLADSYSVSEDGLVTTVTVRSGVTFHNGQKLTAKDAAYSIESCIGTDYYKNRLRNITNVEAVDERTVQITTSLSYECLPLLLDMAVIPDGSMEQSVPAGTGPYQFVSGEKLARYDGWWQQTALVDVPEISLTTADTAVSVRDQFEYSAANLVLTDPNSSAYASFHNDFELWTTSTTEMQYIGYNLYSNVFSNYGLRSAITYAVDRERLVTDHADGFALPSVLPCSPAAKQYDIKLANSFDYDLDDYYAQLESAGVRDMDNDGVLDLYVTSLGYAVPVSGKMIVCSNSYQRVDTAQAIVDALNNLGFDLTLETLDLQDYQDALRFGNFDLYYGEVRLSPNFDLSPFFTLYGALAYGDLDDTTMLNLCSMALLNSGNSYSLYKRLCERGYLTPVLFKMNALYTTRGCIREPAQYLDWIVKTPSEPEE